MSFMVAFSIASIMLLIGFFLRAKVPFLQNMLVPSCVIAGVLGMIFMNVVIAKGWNIGTDTGMFGTIVGQLFTVSFISISLTSAPKNEENSGKNLLKGAIGMGLVWSLLYALTPLLSFFIVAAVGKGAGMDPMYGTLIQYAFCQGPGQSVVYGDLYESYGWTNATTVAVFYATIGFIMAFLIGIPMAKYGIKHGLAKHSGKIDDATLRGYLHEDEQTAMMVKDTTANSNIETLALHFALIGLCYMGALGIGWLWALIPGYFGTAMSSLTFINGMYAAYILKFIMKKLGIGYLIENTLQSKITGWTADYLVVCAFMAVSISLIKAWLFPIIVVLILMTIVTFFVTIYFGRRMGGSNDFERTLAMFGMCTGTVPTGLALMRIVDPNFETTTAVELGACNVVMTASDPVYIILLGFAAGSISKGVTLASLAGLIVAYLIALRLTKTWGKPTFSWKK
ncbi:MAG: sodium:glutamate symporter [Mogibacterium sp.]|nr:sodium:glutamate symporter [Mogibacterium sp.]